MLTTCPPAWIEWNMRPAPRQGGEVGRGEREGVARPGWLVALPSPPEGGKRTRRGGWQTVEALPCGRWLLGDRWRGGGDVVAMTSPRSERGVRPSLSLSADTSGRSGERLAMVWTVEAADGAEGEARNGRRGRRHPSPWFSLFLFCLLCPTSPHEGRGRGRGGQDGRPSRRCPGSLSSWSVCPFALPFPACFYSFSIYNKV